MTQLGSICSAHAVGIADSVDGGVLDAGGGGRCRRVHRGVAIVDYSSVPSPRVLDMKALNTMSDVVTPGKECTKSVDGFSAT